MEAKSIKESRLSISHVLLPHDANTMGNVHGGVIVKHIDNAAAVVAVRHVRCNAVTASIDRIDFHSPVFVGELLKLKASINLTGKTSMEVGVRVETENLISGEIRHTASAYLTFVAVDENGRPKEIPPVKIESDEEVRRNREAVARRRMRLAEKLDEKTG